MRRFLPLLFLLCCVSSAVAQRGTFSGAGAEIIGGGPRPASRDDSKILHLWALKVGQAGYIGEFTVDSPLPLTVSKVLSPDEMIVRTKTGFGDLAPASVALKGVSTDGLADDAQVSFKGVFVVAGTRKFTNGRTLYQLRPETKEEQSVREKAEQNERATTKQTPPQTTVRKGGVVRKIESQTERRQRQQDEIRIRVEAEMRARREVVREKQLQKEKAREVKATQKAAASVDSNLRYAKKLLAAGDTGKAKARLQEIVDKFPGTEAARDAATLLKDIE